MTIVPPENRNLPAVLGRKVLDVDWKQIESLCNIRCSVDEICEVIGQNKETLTKKCKEKHGMTLHKFVQSRSLFGNVSLRRAQYAAAIAGSIPMMIWLGKQWLKQSNEPSQESIAGSDITSLEEAQSIMIKDVAFPTKPLESDAINE